jgi:citrate synthase
MPDTKGLEGVVAAHTHLSLVDGEQGHLVYRGYWARELAKERTFEEVAHLLWYGHLPSREELCNLTEVFKNYRVIPAYVAEIIDRLPFEFDMMSVLRSAVSAMGVSQEWPPCQEDAIRFAAAVPTIIAYRYAKQQGRTPIAPDESLSHVANYLYMLTGQKPSTQHVRALEAYLILTMEHGMNASTFSARVTTSTQSDMASALTSAIGTMKGPLHGGAPSEVMTMLEEIGTPENAEAWIRHALESGERLMGFGHRVYKTRDPRAQGLREVVEQIAGQDPWFDLAVKVEDTAIRLLEEYKPGRRLYTNVEYWAAAILRTVNIPKPLYTPTFTMSRTVGWTAHILEQAANNRLIRPQSVYVGEMPSMELV